MHAPRMASFAFNAGKSVINMKAYLLFYVTPDFQIDSFPLFSQTSQLPLLNPDNIKLSCKNFF